MDRIGPRRLATTGACLALVVAAFAQRPGLTNVDTKLDLTENPLGLLVRAIGMWNDHLGFGQVENQTFGYLFPMGPFFLAGHELGVPGWVTQRAWTALLLVLGFLGFLRLCRAMGIGNEPSRYVAALAWTLGPRIITTLGPISADSLAVVLLPWCLLPLVTARREQPPARAAALSAMTVLAMGGINAAVVLAVLVVPLVWLLAQARDGWGRKMLAWWCVFIGLAVGWWVALLFTMSRYVGEFISRSESATVTSSRISVWQAMRGADHWLGSLWVHTEPWWPAAWHVFGTPIGIIATGVLALLGFAGLLYTDLPRRHLLLALTGIGLVALTLGYAGDFGPWFDEQWRAALEGPLAAFRNVHKFDPVLRLPLTLAIAHLLSKTRLSVPALVPVALVALPLLSGQLPAGQGFEKIPQHWQDTARWLGRHATGTSHLVPGSGFGEYTWGRTYDDPMQPLAEAPWSVRSQVPMGQAGGVRWMDAVESVLASGLGSPALGEFLARAGVGHLVVRNDLQWWRTGSARPAVVHQALERSGGIRLVTSFGPRSRPGGSYAKELVGYDLDPGYPPVEIYEVTPKRSAMALVDAGALTEVSGGPESLLQLLEDGLINVDTPVSLSGDDQAPGAGRELLTDGLQRREVNIGRVHGGVGAAMSADEPYREPRPKQPYDLFPAGYQTLVDYDGATITASSAEGYADSYGPTQPEHHPYAAFDGDPQTFWKSSVFGSPIGQWIQLELPKPVIADHLTIQFAVELLVGNPVTTIALTTEAGTTLHKIEPDGRPQQLPMPPGSGFVQSVRITVLDMPDQGFAQVAIREISIPGVTIPRTLIVPDTLQSAEGISFRQPSPRYTCVEVTKRFRCDPALLSDVDSTVIARTFAVKTPGNFAFEAFALARSGPDIQRLFSDKISASSVFGNDPAVNAANLIDGRDETSWAADGLEPTPQLTYHFPAATTVSSLRLALSPDSFLSPPTELTVIAGGEEHRIEVRGPGTYDFPAVTTDEIKVRIGGFVERFSTDPVTGWRSRLPVGLAELTFPGIGTPRPGTEKLDIPCGEGPPLTLDGQDIPTRVEATISDVVHHRPVRVVACADHLRLDSGRHRMVLAPSAGFVATGLTLRRTTANAVNTQAEALDPDRPLIVQSGAKRLLLVRQNANPGWQATLNGVALEPVRLDGWLQGWIVPEGASGEIHLSFTPEKTYRALLLAGALGAVLLTITALVLFVRYRRVTGPVIQAGDPAWAVWVPPISVFLIGGAGPLAAAFLVRLLGQRVLVISALTGLAAAGAIAFRDGPTSGFAQLLCLYALSALAIPSAWPNALKLRSRVKEPAN